MSQSSHNLDTPNSHYAALKRRIATLEDQNSELRGESGPKSRGDPYLMTGRAIRHLVSLTDRVEDLVGEYDRRTSLYDDDDDPQYTEECAPSLSIEFLT
ncbi:hypothetical protein BDR06DRAFT_1010713 [Suillus hirtellus]|nr:hypothetical protein BDR06DRAFT_1010713 [Suillus hirtellus]